MRKKGSNAPRSLGAQAPFRSRHCEDQTHTAQSGSLESIPLLRHTSRLLHRECHDTRQTYSVSQAIGAYQVKINDSLITFLDTPGHEAFTSMRARGANMTDIAVLVVAADDGIMPQTVESINHAKAANVKIIVAMNKMDKPTANPERVMEGLTKYGIITEDWGGDVACIPVSALTGMGINDLLERIALEAEVMELKANPNRRAKGAVVEARLDKGQGPIRSDGGIAANYPWRR